MFTHMCLVAPNSFAYIGHKIYLKMVVIIISSPLIGYIYLEMIVVPNSIFFKSGARSIGTRIFKNIFTLMIKFFSCIFLKF